MHIYLKDGHQRRWVTDVHLQEGFSPCIGNGLTRKSCADVSRLEPAIWFKVLVLESVSVDCGRRIVSWSTGSGPANEDSDVPNQKTFFMEECYDYDADNDELFLLAAQIICPAGQEENGFCQPSDEDYEQSLLRMLHCYILPKITLHKDDLDKVMIAREKQALNIQTLDRKVIEECKTIDACELRMEDLRTQFLPDLEKFISKGWCSRGFLSLLFEDVSKEEPRLRQQIDKAQDQVQHAKQMLAQKPSDRLKEQLSAARQQRDLEIGKLDALLMARELIGSAIRQTANDTGKITVGHYLLRQYLQEREMLGDLKQNRNRLLEQKNCALSVREMLESATEDLLEKGYTDANDANALGSRATDVLEGVWKPEWQKLGERIATLVNNEEHPIGNHFKQFCRNIHSLCQDFIDLGRLGSDGEFTPSCSPFARPVCPNQCDGYGLEDFVVENHRHKLNMLQDEIFKHLKTATEFLSDFFNNRDVQFKNKIRLCYEQCFYDKEHSFLACVYELAHHEHVDKLERDVQRLKKLPIKLLNLQMKDEWWLQLFEQNSHRASINPGHLRPFTEAYINGTLLDQRDGGLSGSYDMIDDLDDFVADEELEHVDSFRSLCISAIRNRSKTITAEDVKVSIDQPDAGRRPKTKPRVETVLSSSAPAGEMSLTMNEIIDLWETTKGASKHEAENENHGPRRPPLQRTLSKSQGDLSKKDSRVSGETFEDHFGPALQNIRDIFKVTSPLNKLKCLTSSLRKITNAVQELRMRSGKDTFSAAVNAEDLLPLLVLMMLQMEPWEAATMWPQLAFTEDLMAPFLQSGCHGWALVEFQMAQRVLDDLCKEF